MATKRPFLGGGDVTRRPDIVPGFSPRFTSLFPYDEDKEEGIPRRNFRKYRGYNIPTNFLTEAQRRAISLEEAGETFTPGFEDLPAGKTPTFYETYKTLESCPRNGDL